MILDLLFGCRHNRMTFPQTRGGVTSQSCLDCGRAYSYDLEAMRRGAEIPPTPYVKAERPAVSARVVEIAVKRRGRKNG